MLQGMPYWLINLLSVSSRWVHIVGATLIVGGVLFFQWVVPLATSDLREEQQLAVFGRCRWLFRRVLWISVIGLLVSGAYSLWRLWPIYVRDESSSPILWLTPLPWALSHLALGLVGFALAFRITAGRNLLDRPVVWLRVTLTILLIGVFLASAARHVRIQAREHTDAFRANYHPTP